jgi:UDP-glucose 4-epimerase
MKILVTGSSGFIGSHLCERLQDRGHDMLMLDKTASPKMKNKTLLCNIVDYEKVERLVNGVDAIFHMAAITSVPFAVNNPRLTWEVNVLGTANVLEAARVNHVGKFLYASSSSVLGSYPLIDGGVREDYPMKPVNPYGASKAAGEMLVESYRQTYGMNTTCLRFANVYGPGQKEINVIWSFIRRAMEGKPLLVHGGGKQTRNFTYIDDAVEGAILALEKDAVGVYHISGGKAVSIREVVEIIIKYMPSTTVNEEPTRIGEAETQGLLSIEKAKAELGYTPKVDIDEGIGRCIEWIKKYHLEVP